MRHRLGIWSQAIRPKTLGASFAPVLSSVGLEISAARSSWGTVLCIFLAALAIQVTTNLTNDLCDFLKGADTEDRLGPTRVTQAGLVSVHTMKFAIGLAVLLAVLSGIPLVIRGGPTILLIGSLSLLLAFGYTAGPLPLAYFGLGELFAFIFFGPVATLGTSYLLLLSLDPKEYGGSLVLGCSCGLLSASLLVINNIRDRMGDEQAKKFTLAVRLSDRFARLEYALLVVTGLLLPVLGYCLGYLGLWSALAALGVLAFLAREIGRVLGGLEGRPLNAVLATTGRALMIFGITQFFAGVFSS